MSEPNKGSKEMDKKSNTFVFQRDLLQRFIGEDDEEEEEEGDDEIELNLGLSLGGRFGVDKSKKLVRSSSVVATMPLFLEMNSSAETAVMRHTGLMRTTSLPAESEEEWRKRKEIQSLRRMAAKRRRSEKLRSGGGDNNPGEVATSSRRRGKQSSGLPPWSGGLLRQHSAGGSFESHGGGSSSSVPPEFETKSNQASSEEARTIPSTQQNEEATNQTNQLRRLSSVDMKIEPQQQEKGKTKMPCVFTTGPNGKRVDGILYSYGNNKEVKIMCVCHGDFLSPSDFVKHAGGPLVDHPLRHIVVNTASSANLL